MSCSSNHEPRFLATVTGQTSVNPTLMNGDPNAGDEAIWGTHWYMFYLPVCNHNINKPDTFQSRYWRLTLAVYISRPVRSVTVLMKICHHVFMQFTPHKSTVTEKKFSGNFEKGITHIPWAFFYKHQHTVFNLQTPFTLPRFIKHKLESKTTFWLFYVYNSDMALLCFSAKLK